MVFDYEKAWADLLHTLSSDSRPNWSARQLRDEMGRILERRRVNESGQAAMLRLYGVEVEARLQAHPAPEATGDEPAENHDETAPTRAADATPVPTATAARHHRSTRGGHDGRAAAAGAARPRG